MINEQFIDRVIDVLIEMRLSETIMPKKKKKITPKPDKYKDKWTPPVKKDPIKKPGNI